MIDLAICGATGRVGRLLVKLAKESPDFKLVAAIGRADGAGVGQDAGEIAGISNIGLPITHDLRPTPGVMIDFTRPAAMRHWLKACRDRKIPMVIGTTGLTPEDHQSIDVAAETIPVMWAPNMSVGVAVLFKIAGEVAKALGMEYDVEVVEAHHRHKADAPSGTAIGLAHAILDARGQGHHEMITGRSGKSAIRTGHELAVHSLRIGDEVGRHTAFFGTNGERLELTHQATNRETFARGALRAAKWLSSQKPGRYHIQDLLTF